MSIEDTILSNSTFGGDCSGTINSGGYNLIEDTANCTVQGDAATNITGVDRILGALADNGGSAFTHKLGPGSPAVDAGDPTCPPPATDQRGVARAQGGDCDIGAYEDRPPIASDDPSYSTD